ncbi:MAG: acetate--CoA ligase family protein, partial [Gammaproteobacteria bacterium]
MSTRNLNALFRPESVAIVGASERPESLGRLIMQNMQAAGFKGTLIPVNPKYRQVAAQDCIRRVEDLATAPDLAVICTPPATIPGIVETLAGKGTRAAVVITAGFSELGTGEGKQLEEKMLRAARPGLLRIVGPNCLGVMAPGVGLNASFAHLTPHKGRIAFVAQSGAIVTSVLDWAQPRGIGFSHLVSLGDMADVDIGDMLDYLAADPHTHAILLYVEGITQARKFMSAARAASRLKPVIVVKAGRFAEGARAASSHTGALAGGDAVAEAAFRRAGMLRVYSLEDLFETVEILSTTRLPRGDRMAILTNGGGMGVLATDALVEAGGTLAVLAPDTLQTLDAALPRTWSHGNPVDIIGDADGSRYQTALEPLLRAREVDAVLILNCPTGVASSAEAAQAVVDTVGQRPAISVLTSWVGGQAAVEGRRILTARGLPTFDTPEQAVGAFMYLVDYQRVQELLTETPPSISEDFAPDTHRVRELIDNALAGGQEWLDGLAVRDVLAAYGIPANPIHFAATPDEAAEVAARIRGPVALKIHSPDIIHKTEVGGVALNLDGPEAVRNDANAMLERIATQHPNARLEGFTVEPMISRRGSFELIAGITVDPVFGPVVLFGQGGTAVEVINDKNLALPPLNMHLARDLMSRTRIFRLLSGYRGMAGADIDQIALTLIKVAQLAADFAEILELDINPLLADERGVLAIDARVRIAATTEPPTRRLAIRPYPRELETEISLPDGRSFNLRPIRPEDELPIQATFSRLTQEEIRLRFFAPLKALSHRMAARLTQIDYDREMALVLTGPGLPGEADIHGVVRISADPDNERAEYSVLVWKRFTGLGLGTLLMEHIID